MKSLQKNLEKKLELSFRNALSLLTLNLLKQRVELDGLKLLMKCESFGKLRY
jgi:hypothetical protein